MKLYKRLGIKADIEALAAGIIDQAKELSAMDGIDYLTAITFGMLPAPLMDCMDRSLKKRFCEVLCCEDITKTLIKITMASADELFDEIKFTIQELVSEIMHEISLEIYKQSPMIV